MSNLEPNQDETSETAPTRGRAARLAAGTVNAVVLVAMIALMVASVATVAGDAVHTSSGERAADDAADRAVSVIRKHDQPRANAGNIVGTTTDSSLADSLAKEFKGDGVRFTATSLTSRSVTMTHGRETRTIHLGSSPKATSGWGFGDIFGPKPSSGKPAGDARRIASLVSDYGRQHGDVIDDEQDLVDTRSDDEELADAINDEFGDSPPEIEFSDRIGLVVKSADREDFVYINPTRVGGLCRPAAGTRWNC